MMVFYKLGSQSAILIKFRSCPTMSFKYEMQIGL